MLKPIEVDRLVDRAATTALKGIGLAKVYSAATTDSDGRDAINVTIVLNPGDQHKVTGDAALNAIVRIQRDLRASGDSRYAIVDFTAEDELTASGDTQS